MLRTLIEWNSPGGDPYYTTMHWDGLIGAAGTAHSAAATFLQAMDNFISNLYSATVTSDVFEVDPATGLTVDQATVPEVVVTGAVAGQPVPLTSQFLIRWRTGLYLNGREVRGRTFLPGFIAANVTNGSLSATAQTPINTALSTWLAGPGLSAVVWSPRNGVAVGVATATVWSEMATLRSRRD